MAGAATASRFGANCGDTLFNSPPPFVILDLIGDLTVKSAFIWSPRSRLSGRDDGLGEWGRYPANGEKSKEQGPYLQSDLNSRAGEVFWFPPRCWIHSSIGSTRCSRRRDYCDFPALL